MPPTFFRFPFELLAGGGDRLRARHGVRSTSPTRTSRRGSAGISSSTGVPTRTPTACISRSTVRSGRRAGARRRVARAGDASSSCASCCAAARASCRCSRSARRSCATSARRSSSGTTGASTTSQRPRRRVSTTTAAGSSSRSSREFPRFDDSVGDVRFWKLAQLAVWILEITLRDDGGLGFDDLDELTAFADYIVPAALESMGDPALLRRALARDRGGTADRGGLAVGGRAARAHDQRLLAALRARERAPAAGAAGDRAADRRAALAAVSQDAPAASPDADDLLLTLLRSPVAADTRRGGRP